MSQLFRKEAMDRRSRALFGEVILRGPLSPWIIGGLVLLTVGLIGFILFGLRIEGLSIWSWLRG